MMDGAEPPDEVVSDGDVDNYMLDPGDTRREIGGHVTQMPSMAESDGVPGQYVDEYGRGSVSYPPSEPPLIVTTNNDDIDAADTHSVEEHDISGLLTAGQLASLSYHRSVTKRDQPAAVDLDDEEIQAHMLAEKEFLRKDTFTPRLSARSPHASPTPSYAPLTPTANNLNTNSHQHSSTNSLLAPLVSPASARPPSSARMVMPEAFGEDASPLALTGSLLANMTPEEAEETVRNHIKQLGMYIPGRLIKWYIDRAHELTNRVTHMMFTEQYDAAVLFVDISGFSKLAEQLEKGNRVSIATKTLSKEVGEALGPLVKIILEWGGDVIKFAGDATFAIFSTSAHGNMENAIAAACLAARKMVRFSLYNASSGVKLEVHCGIGAGKVLGLHVGGVLNRWEYAISGDPIIQVANAEKAAEAGQVVISTQALAQVSKFCDTEEISPENHLLKVMYGEDLGATVVRTKRFWDELDRMDVATLHKIYLHIIPYVPRPVIQAMSEGQFAHLAEVRLCVTLFIKLLNLPHNNPGDILQVHKIERLVQKKMYSFSGATMCRLIVDDKGLTNLWAFGMPPYSFSETKNYGFFAVCAAMELHQALKEKGHSCNIGITAGRVFCGTVGGSQRSEYTLHGTQVNLAARLMGKAKDGVLVDDTIFTLTDTLVAYEPPMVTQVKGKEGDILVYKPIKVIDESKIPEHNFPSLGDEDVPTHSHKSGGGNSLLLPVTNESKGNILRLSVRNPQLANNNSNNNRNAKLGALASLDSSDNNGKDGDGEPLNPGRRCSDPVPGSLTELSKNVNWYAGHRTNSATPGPVRRSPSDDTHTPRRQTTSDVHDKGRREHSASDASTKDLVLGGSGVPKTSRTGSVFNLWNTLNPGHKYCKECGKSGPLSRTTCRHCGGSRFTNSKADIAVKKCAACGQGTNNKKRTVCESCGSHRFVEEKAQN